MNILVDGRTFVKPSAGISTFLQGSLEAWAINCPNDTFYLALPQNKNITAERLCFPRNVKWVISNNFFFRKLPNLVWLCIMMPILSWKYNIGVYFSPVPCLPFFLKKKIKKIIVVHDVVNIEYRETMEWANRVASYFFNDRSIKHADIIWTNSYYTKDCVNKYYPKRKCKDIFVGCSVNRKIYKKMRLTQKQVMNIRTKIGIKERFLLFVGSLEPRKNLPFLLSLMPQIYHDTGMKLLVVGAKGWKNTEINEIISQEGYPRECVVFSGYISNEELAIIYNIAEMFVSPSLNEGFGMPQLEAMLCGCPVITADNSAMIEVAKGKPNALLIEGYNKYDWISGIKQMQTITRTVEENLFSDYDWNQIINRLIK